MLLDKHLVLMIAVALIVFILIVVISPFVDLPAAANRVVATIFLLFACLVAALTHFDSLTITESKTSFLPTSPKLVLPRNDTVLLC